MIGADTFALDMDQKIGATSSVHTSKLNLWPENVFLVNKDQKLLGGRLTNCIEEPSPVEEQNFTEEWRILATSSLPNILEYS